MRSLAILAALSTGCGGGCDPPLVSDRCNEPQAASLSSLEIGQGQGDLFQPLADGDAVPRVWGGQGSPMVVVHLRMTGQVPGCVAQSSTLLDGDGNVMDSEPGAMTTYPAGDGARTTGQMFLILDYDTIDGEVIVIRSEAGGVTSERALHLQTVGPDAMIDGGDGDAAPFDAGPDAGGDAAPADAGLDAGADATVDGG